MSTRLIIPWFGGESKVLVHRLYGTEKVAYSWNANTHEQDLTIRDLLVWHDCDKNLWERNPNKFQDVVRESKGWVPTGVGLHGLASVEPLTLDGSLYWPDCCGMHGFIRDGTWTDA